MTTINQIIRKNRVLKRKKTINKILQNCPQKKGVCVKVYIQTPRKPNSAKRKVAKIKLSNNKYTIAYIPGIGHSLQQHSTVLVRGGGVKDLAGVNYKIVRGKFDLSGVEKRIKARSKFGVKKKTINKK
jgi:small subunit ribosomal protein S12